MLEFYRVCSMAWTEASEYSGELGDGKAGGTMLEEHHKGNEICLINCLFMWLLQVIPGCIHNQSSAAWWPEGAACPSPEDKRGVC